MAEEQSAEQQARVLVVDDNEMNRDMLSRRLERQGHQVIVAENGIRALELLNETSIDLVLLDIMMPKMNGYEVLEQVKKDLNLRHIPIIMISAVDDLDSVVKCIELGADDYLFKPFNPVLLKARVSASLDKKRMHDLQHAGSNGSANMQALQPSVAAILDTAQQLISGQAGPLTDSQTELLKSILNNVEQLSKALER